MGFESSLDATDHCLMPQMKAAFELFSTAGRAAAVLRGDPGRPYLLDNAFPFYAAQGLPGDRTELIEAAVVALNTPSEPPLAEFILDLGEMARDTSDERFESTHPAIIMLHHLNDAANKELAGRVPVVVVDALHRAVVGTERMLFSEISGSPLETFYRAAHIARKINRDFTDGEEFDLPDGTTITDAHDAMIAWIWEGRAGFLEVVAQAHALGETNPRLFGELQELREATAPGTPGRAKMLELAHSESVFAAMTGSQAMGGLEP